MKRIMLDLETLSSRPNAAIVSIGAVAFDEDTPYDVGPEFYVVLNTEDQVRDLGRDVDPGTFAWWCQQSDEARAVFKERADQVGIALRSFSNFVDVVGNPKDIEVWGNGADFDCVVLGGLYEAYGLEKPWSFRNNRCFRTLKNLGIRLEAGEGVERTGHHNALADAKYQAIYAGLYLRKMRT